MNALESVKKKNKEPISEFFVNTMVNIGRAYAEPEYTSEMINVGVTYKQLPRAALEFAIDNMPHEFDTRLTNAERLEVEKRLLKYFKGVLS
jgi:hypothetical protein